MADDPILRVGLVVGATEVRIGSQGGMVAGRDGRRVFRRDGGEQVRIVPGGARVIQVGAGSNGNRYASLRFTSTERSRFVTVDGRPYRGVVEVFVGRAGLTVVNVVRVEAYLPGVVTAEMGRRAASERAALDAQAIVSRTYALENRGRFEAEGYDVRSTVTDQAYGGVAAETGRGWEAVRSTAGRVLTYAGELITPFFHSTCGYSTGVPAEAFRFGTPVPYLVPVSDRHGDGYYCDISPNFRWSVEWDGAELANILRRTVPDRLGIEAARVEEIRGVRVQRTGPSGRVLEARIQVPDGEIPVFAPDLRQVFTRPDGRSLGSTAIQFAAEREGGRITRLRVQGAGWGHGLGMCQWGAVGRARAGQDAETILTTYFPGARIERWY